MHWKIIVLGCWLFCRVHIQLSPHFPTLYHWMLFNVGNQQNVFVKRWGRNEGSHSNEKWEWSEVSLSEKRKSSSARNHGNYMPNSAVVKLYWNCKPTFIPVWEIFVALVCICQRKKKNLHISIHLHGLNTYLRSLSHKHWWSGISLISW